MNTERADQNVAMLRSFFLPLQVSVKSVWVCVRFEVAIIRTLFLPLQLKMTADRRQTTAEGDGHEGAEILEREGGVSFSRWNGWGDCTGCAAATHPG